MKFKLTPWPSRRERRRDVEAARQLARDSGDRAASAARLERDLQQMAADNHFAQFIRAAITGREQPDSTGG